MRSGRTRHRSTARACRWSCKRVPLTKKPAERGYAHYVEHLVFGGTRDYPGDAAFATLQKLGVMFGPHANAATSPFETHYRFDNLPVDDPVALATGLKILRAMMDGARFEAAVVKRECQIILGEMRSRDGMMSHVTRDGLEFLPLTRDWPNRTELCALFADTRLVGRFPQGDEAVLNAVTLADLNALARRLMAEERLYQLVVRPN